MLDGNDIPVLGFGTWPLDDDAAFAAVGEAIRAGYRLIDTAATLRQRGRRRARDRGGGDPPRRGVRDHEAARRTARIRPDPSPGLDQSLGRLGLDNVDLYLIHWPLPQHRALRRVVAGADRPARRGPGAIDRRLQLHG